MPIGTQTCWYRPSIFRTYYYHSRIEYWISICSKLNSGSDSNNHIHMNVWIFALLYNCTFLSFRKSQREASTISTITVVFLNQKQWRVVRSILFSKPSPPVVLALQLPKSGTHSFLAIAVPSLYTLSVAFSKLTASSRPTAAQPSASDSATGSHFPL